MINPSRRAFVACVVASAGALSATQASAQAGTVTEADPLAVGLGYKPDHTKVDKAKFPNYDPTHVCSGCQQFQGKAGDATGPCQLFGNRLVAGNGWCSAWVKKA